MVSNIVIVCVFFNIFGYIYMAPTFNTTCKQPRGDICVEIWECPFFVRLNNMKIPKEKKIEEMRKYLCGLTHDRKTPKVCCTISPDKSNNARTYLKEIYQRPDVKYHKNLDLLPTENCGFNMNGIYNRITGGSETKLLEFPWMALIAYTTKDGFEFRCGGTVINKRYVLTAAHCILDTLAGVRLGEHNINTEIDCDKLNRKCAPPDIDFYIEERIVHPDYVSNTSENDIALIRLATPVNFSGGVQPICLPIGDAAKINLKGKHGIVAGWGITETGFKPSTLRKVSIPIISNEVCRSFYEKYAPVTNRQICAGGYFGRDSCAGDSGGPLLRTGFIEGSRRYIQQGIVSYGPRNCGTEGEPGVYTRVSYYTDWILDNIKP